VPCSQASLQGIPEFLREVTVLGVYRHPHLLPLLSFSLSRLDGQQEACLVYPLMPRGGLDQALAARAAPLDAAARLRIAADTAAGLAYLHAPGGGLAALLHRDVKSSNVLLDDGLRARVADVGLARPQHGATMTAGVGTFGYIDPDYFTTGQCPHPDQGLLRPASAPTACLGSLNCRERKKSAWPGDSVTPKPSRARACCRRVHASVRRLLLRRDPGRAAYRSIVLYTSFVVA
jgi:serine/threonine protein kinase